MKTTSLHCKTFACEMSRSIVATHSRSHTGTLLCRHATAVLLMLLVGAVHGRMMQPEPWGRPEPWSPQDPPAVSQVVSRSMRMVPPGCPASPVAFLQKTHKASAPDYQSH